ncbi:uncharacterized protein BT62DRAFT_1080865 [Guyanagaster necrorhizus]|uniref:Uncharacterized protein n=1 Tax=Guyanagaster necrorhizus TaxID=856835 RepID=A0A9P8ALM2_9AGAR|nr:uncharacterized protein BT62DRAFT_1080865 [Guyanagaster necrorhizus MCA 3950]KAG7440358.1 hypothetical protein BT62DRAFT_1080865 [Guyanagaster necrorhizus MCA 3950]
MDSPFHVSIVTVIGIYKCIYLLKTNFRVALKRALHHLDPSSSSWRQTRVGRTIRETLTLRCCPDEVKMDVDDEAALEEGEGSWYEGVMSL